MFSWRNKKNINTLWLKKVPYLEYVVSGVSDDLDQTECTILSVF